MDDDFNTPEAVAVLFDLANELNRSKSPETATLLKSLASLVGLLQREPDAFLQGGLKPNAAVTTLMDGGALLRLDGEAGFGQVIGAEAMALGIARAQTHGSCIVALGNSHHLGRIGAWAEMAAAADLVSLLFVNVISRPIVAPFGGFFALGALGTLA